MKKFIFKLQALLKYRQYLEHLARQETAKAYQDVVECKKLIENLKDLYSKKADELDIEASRGISAAYFRHCQDYLDSVEIDIKNQMVNLIQFKKILADMQKKLIVKSVDKKVIERLNQKKANEYMDEFRKDEQKSSDEISSLKKAREIIDAVQ